MARPSKLDMQKTISCPSCQRELRVPDEFIGTQIKCGACESIFVATTATPAPQDNQEKVGSVSISTSEEADHLGSGSNVGSTELKDGVRRKRRKKRKWTSQGAQDAVFAPSICIIALGGLEIVFYIIYGIAISGLMSSESPEPEMPKMPRGFEHMAPIKPDLPPIQQHFGPYQIGRIAGLMTGICWGCFIIFGGISMKMLTSFRTAFVVSIAVMIPCTPGCVLGLPIGIWRGSELICQNLNHTVRGSNWVPRGLKSRSPRHCFLGPGLRFGK
jgi:hypothetical protein